VTNPPAAEAPDTLARVEREVGRGLPGSTVDGIAADAPPPHRRHLDGCRPLGERRSCVLGDLRLVADGVRCRLVDVFVKVE